MHIYIYIYRYPITAPDTEYPRRVMAREGKGGSGCGRPGAASPLSKMSADTELQGKLSKAILHRAMIAPLC